MTKFEIAKQYMDTRYPNKTYAMREGNACVWVTMGLVDMYFIIRDNQIVDIQVD